MSSVPDNRASASAASEQTSPTYTFRTMRELDALIAKADLRVQWIFSLKGDRPISMDTAPIGQ